MSELKQLKYHLHGPVTRNFYFDLSKIFLNRRCLFRFRWVKPLLIIKILDIGFISKFILLRHYSDKIPKTVDFSFHALFCMIRFRKASSDSSFRQGCLAKDRLQKGGPFTAGTRQNGPALPFKHIER